MTFTVAVSCEVVMVEAIDSHLYIVGRPRSMKPALDGCRLVPDNAGTVIVVDTLSLTRV